MSRNKPTYLYAIVSVALVLYIVGLFTFLGLRAQQLVTLFKEKVEIWLELRPGVPPSEVDRVVRYVRNEPFVKRESVQFIDHRQAAEIMRKDLGDENLAADLPEMMRDVVRFNVRANFMNADSLAVWREVLRRDSTVAELYYEAVNTGNIGNNLQKIGWLTLALAILLIFAAVTLIHNTIRLALYANRFLIKNQELVGATWSFISRPYIQRGILNGLWSAALAILALLLTLWIVQGQLPEFNVLDNPISVVFLFVGLLLLGVLISGFSSYLVVNKFLSMRVDDLY
jgi:cell division transport system permease protein